MSFHENFCGCLKRPPSCLVAFFVPAGVCCLQGKSLDKAYKRSCWGPCLLGVFFCCIGTGINRSKIRRHYEIEGNRCCDCLIHLFCSPCAASQEYREVLHREPR